ncbi:multiple epidermal growth factor-like domains protein 10 [Crassostrea angulata]|uniref:multiple epidermal growth factor-like domains protein 10 n=1 Tax=Magallana angulata TaxID=2784310 RepID=UPI0022B1557D|nr:multiple epidermal growth factor-like domains protein 10 [Crassostrea angulata]
MFCSLFIVLPLLVIQFVNMTGRIEGKCYANHMWDSEEGQCKPCPQGYFGINCTSKCLMPFYGLKCKSTCNCTDDKCHHIQGCNEIQSVTDSYGSTVENDTNMTGKTFTTETESKWMRPVIFGVFGLAGLLFFITVIYMYNFKHQHIKRTGVAETT